MERLEAILRMILNYLKPLELKKSLTDPNMLAQKVLSEMEAEIKKRKVGLDIRSGQIVAAILIDRAIMEKVLGVLLKNALSQMPDDAILKIETLQDNSMFKLVMRYPALNVTANDVEDFFYPFTTSRTAQGIGIDSGYLKRCLFHHLLDRQPNRRHFASDVQVGKKRLDQEVKRITENPTIGEKNKCVLRGVFVNKFNSNNLVPACL